MTNEFTVTPEQLQAAFTEWDRQYREDPEAFVNPAYQLLYGNADDYGSEAAAFFLTLLDLIKESK